MVGRPSLAEPVLEVPSNLDVWLREPLENTPPQHKSKKAAAACVSLIAGEACSGGLPKSSLLVSRTPLATRPPHKLKRQRPPALILSPARPVLESCHNFDF